MMIMMIYLIGLFSGLLLTIGFWIRRFLVLRNKYDLLRRDCETVVRDNARLRHRNSYLESMAEWGGLVNSSLTRTNLFDGANHDYKRN